MMNVLKRNLRFRNSRHLLTRSIPSTHPNSHLYSTSPNSSEKPYAFRSRPFLFTGTFLGLYQTIAAGTSLCAYLYFYYTDSSTHFLGGSTATRLLALHVPFTNGKRTVGDFLDTALRRAMTTSLSWVSWSRWSRNKEDQQKTVEDVLDNLEGPDGPARKRWKERLSEAGIALEGGGRPAIRIDSEKLGTGKTINSSVLDP